MAPRCSQRQATHTSGHTPVVHHNNNNPTIHIPTVQPVHRTPLFQSVPGTDRLARTPSNSPSEGQHFGKPNEPPSSVLDPAAPEFVPFALQATSFDDKDNLLENADFQEHGTRIEQLVEDQQLMLMVMLGILGQAM